MKNPFFLCCVMLGMLPGIGSTLSEEMVVIVSAGNPYAIDKNYITKIFLGKVNTWPDGKQIDAFDQPEDSPVHDQFYSQTLGKSPSLVKMLWAQNLFSGKCLPPKILMNDTLVLQAVKSNNNAIGYIQSSYVDKSVRVISP
jgi:ABC-type phosphate transport system substrate-binding protein